jgi:hypothetical protein
LLLAALLFAGVSSVHSEEGKGPVKRPPMVNPPTPRAPGDDGSGAKKDETGELDWAPEKVEWIDLDGAIPEDWGWGGRVVLSWEKPEIETAALERETVGVRLSNEGTETAHIPNRGFYSKEILYEDQVVMPEGEEVICSHPVRGTTPLEAGKSLSIKIQELQAFPSRIPGRYTITLSRKVDSAVASANRRWRLLPPLRIRIVRPETAAIEELVGKMEKRDSWQSVFTVACWGDLCDSRLLPPLEGFARELGELPAKDKAGSEYILEMVRFAIARIRVLLALEAGKDDEVRCFLEAKQPDDHDRGHFKAMLRALIETHRKGR